LPCGATRSIVRISSFYKEIRHNASMFPPADSFAGEPN
jgi:hypothetical protein